MITAVVLIDVEVSAIPEVAQQIAEISQVSEVFSVTGDIDLVALVRVDEHEELADVIADEISKIPGVHKTQTYIAFRTYSRADMEAAFDIGLT